MPKTTLANKKATAGRPMGQRIPCTGASTMTDEEFAAHMWSTVPTAAELADRGTGARSGQ